MPLHSENQDYAPLKPLVGGGKPSAENGRESASVSAFKRSAEESEESRKPRESGESREVATLLPPGFAAENKDPVEEKIANEFSNEFSVNDIETLAPIPAVAEEQP